MLHRGGADRDPIDQERAGVIEQALAFQDFEDPVRQVDLAQDSGGRGGIRWRNDGTECDRSRPRHLRDQPMRQHGDDGCGNADGKQHQRRDRHPIVAEIAQRSVVGGIEQYRCDEQRQCESGLQRP